MDQILQAAAQVFARAGYAGTTTNEIAQRAGVSIGSLYQYFPNKEAILVALVQDHMQQAAGEIQKVLEDALQQARPLEQLLREMVQAVLALHTASPGLMRVLLHEAPRPPVVVALIHQTEDRLAATMEALLAREPGIHLRHAAHAAYLIVHLVEGLAHEFSLHPPRTMDAPTFVAEVVALLRGYLAQPCVEGPAS